MIDDFFGCSIHELEPPTSLYVTPRTSVKRTPLSQCSPSSLKPYELRGYTTNILHLAGHLTCRYGRKPYPLNAGQAKEVPTYQHRSSRPRRTDKYRQSTKTIQASEAASAYAPSARSRPTSLPSNKTPPIGILSVYPTGPTHAFQARGQPGHHHHRHQHPLHPSTAKVCCGRLRAPGRKVHVSLTHGSSPRHQLGGSLPGANSTSQ